MLLPHPLHQADLKVDSTYEQPELEIEEKALETSLIHERNVRVFPSFAVEISHLHVLYVWLS
jgi:hypothetical protein